MTTENQKGLTQNRYLYHRVFDTLDTTAMQNPKGASVQSFYLISFSII